MKFFAGNECINAHIDNNTLDKEQRLSSGVCKLLRKIFRYSLPYLYLCIGKTNIVMKQKKEKKKGAFYRFRHSLSTKLTWRVMLTLLFVTSLSTIAVIFISGVIITYQEMVRFGSMVEITNLKVNGMLTSVEATAVNSAPDFKECIAHPDKVGQVTEEVLARNEQLIGCGIGFKANYFPSKGRWYELYATRTDSTGTEVREIGSESHDYLNAEWYTGAIEQGKPVWSEPYYDEAGGGRILCSYSMPIRDDRDSIIAVFGSDIDLNGLSDIVNNNDHDFAIISDDKVYSFVISHNGTFIVHPDKERIIRDNFYTFLEENDDAEDDEIAVKMSNGQPGFSVIRLEDGSKEFIYYAPLKSTGWTMVFAMPKSGIFQLAMNIGSLILVIMLFSLFVTLVACYLIFRGVTKPLKRFAKSADEIAKGNFNAPLPMVASHDEVRQLNDSFREMQRSLRQYMEELKETTTQKASIESELNIARGIQMAMLPKTFPPYPDRSDIDIFAQLTPAKAVGGDLYDFYIREGKLFFCVGDVSGKVVPASLVMAVTRALFRTASAHEAVPGRIASAINQVISDNNETNMFVTLFIGSLDLATGEMDYCNAGHDAPLLMGTEGIGLLPVDSNLPIGVTADWEFSTQHTMIHHGTMIFLYTDGLTEAENIKHMQFGEERIYEVAHQAQTEGDDNPETLIRRMTDAVSIFVGEAEQSDDLTMLTIKYC